MKFYIAGRFSHEPSRILIQNMIHELTSLGYECTFDWTGGKSCKPYEKNTELTKISATKAAQGVKDTELFIMVSHPEGTGMYVEYGIALGTSRKYENWRTKNVSHWRP